MGGRSAIPDKNNDEIQSSSEVRDSSKNKKPIAGLKDTLILKSSLRVSLDSYSISFLS